MFQLLRFDTISERRNHASISKAAVPFNGRAFPAEKPRRNSRVDSYSLDAAQRSSLLLAGGSRFKQKQMILPNFLFTRFHEGMKSHFAKTLGL